jgi:GNAT superfamily N-acetyltransferase
MGLIQELADYEKASSEVELSVEDFKAHGFGADPKFVLWVAEEKNEIVGMALCYWRYSTWKGPSFYLEDLVVRESHRRRGIGDVLFEEVKQYAAEHNAKRLEWQVLDWNKPAIEFYKKKQAALDGGWLNARLTANQL